jgi:integrase
MARLVKPLTATQVNNAKPKTAMYKMFDGGGLFLQVNPSGGKYWKMKYRKDDGKEGLLTFGGYPAISLEQARRKRDEARSHKAAGVDPGEVKRREKTERTERAKNTFEAIARAWMEVHSSKVKPQSLSVSKAVLEKYVFPIIGRIPVRSLKAPDFLDVIRRLEALGYLCTARRAGVACSLVMRFAVATGQADIDPLPSLRGSTKTYKGKHLASTTEPKEVGRLLRAIWSYHGSFVVACALKIAPYVFVRPGELQQARWSDIDFENCEWRYTAPKTDTPHIVPLAPQVMEILKKLYPLTGEGEWIFPGAVQSDKPMGKTTIMAGLRRIGIGQEEMTPHGFRAMARTILDEVLGERYDIIEQQLAHMVRDPNRRAYNRTVHLEERKRMMCRWADYLDGLRVQACQEQCKEAPETAV